MAGAGLPLQPVEAEFSLSRSLDGSEEVGRCVVWAYCEVLDCREERYSLQYELP